MLDPWNNKDLMIDHRGDLLIKKTNSNGDLVQTNNASQAHTLAQAIYLAIKTDKGDFKYTPKFGASPQPFVGAPLTAQLVQEVERYVFSNLEKAGLMRSNLIFEVKAAPINRHEIAIRVQVTHPRQPARYITRIDMMYSTADNSVTPRNPAYGADIG